MTEQLSRGADKHKPTLLAGLSATDQASAAQAVQALQSGRASQAAGQLQQLLLRSPAHAGLLRLTGMAQRMSGQAEHAVVTLQRAIKAAPDDPLAASSLGVALIETSHKTEGILQLQRACALAPQSAVLWNNLGKALIDCGRIEHAIDPLRKAIELQASLSQARFSLAYALTVTGDGDGAAAQYRELLADHPADGEVWMGLAQLKTGQLGEQDIEHMRALLSGNALAAGDHIAIEFALGQALHDHKQYSEAFAAYCRANSLLRQRKPWDAGANSTRVDQVLANGWPISEKPGTVPRVVFIVGLPRSGTSITEQILGMHAQVVPGGELDVLGKVVHGVAGTHGATYPQALQTLGTREWRQLGDAYLRGAREGLGAQAVLTDKRPGNWMFVGAALNMLPDARIVVCRRDPLEVGFSCFRNRFSYDNQLFANDFESIARYWHDFDRACRHWQELFPERVMDFSYEALLEDKDAAIRKLLAFCELPFDPACLNPEHSRETVRTLSATQVRKPLQKGSAVTDHYGELLDPLRKLLP